MELREALDQISQIRDQMTQATVFRGYRSLTVGFSGLLGVLAAVGQAIWLPRPMENIDAYLALWIGVASVSLIVGVGEIWLRARANPSELARRRTVLVLEQFAPCLIAGGLLTITIVQRSVAPAWMLPGVWSTLFSLGIFASYRSLPRPVFLIGVYYLVGGALALAWGSETGALSPWTMGLVFGGGQLLSAAVLYFTLERDEHVRSET